MNFYLAFTILICLSAGFVFLNQKLFDLPFVFGLFILSTLLSLIVISSKLWLNIPIKKLKHILNWQMSTK